MKDTFNLQDTVFDLFKVDVELLGLLGDPIGDDELNNKIRRETFDDSQLDASSVNFVSFFLYHSNRRRTCRGNSRYSSWLYFR